VRCTWHQHTVVFFLLVHLLPVRVQPFLNHSSPAIAKRLRTSSGSPTSH
jgi:hypothetical protein